MVDKKTKTKKSKEMSVKCKLEESKLFLQSAKDYVSDVDLLLRDIAAIDEASSYAQMNSKYIFSEHVLRVNKKIELQKRLVAHKMLSEKGIAFFHKRLIELISSNVLSIQSKEFTLLSEIQALILEHKQVINFMSSLDVIGNYDINMMLSHLLKKIGQLSKKCRL